MKKIIILIPIFNDWQSVFKLLENINTEVSSLEGEFSIIIVNDASSEARPEMSTNLEKLKSIKIINMKENRGHARCNAAGLKYIFEKEEFDYVIPMDGDGEDRPEEIKLFIENFNYHPNIINDTEILNGVTSYEAFATAKLQLNGHDRFAARNASYFRTCQPIQSGHKIPRNKIYNYSFALKPEEHQPSGTCNFSRIDNAKMLFTTGGTYSGSTLTVYAVNYNVLRIMSGMGGLAYSN